MPAQAASPTDTLGVYRGAANATGVAAFGTWLGRPPGHALDFLPSGSWSELTQPNWWLDGWSGSAYRTVFSVPMLPDSGATMQDGAAGAYDAQWRQLAQTLVAHGQGDAVLRIGWEMNGDWYRWSIANGASTYAAYWRKIVTAMRAVAPGLKFDFCPGAGSSWVNGGQLNPEAAYPGDAYVDYIGMDVYDQGWAPNYTDPVARWNDQLNTRYGLLWQRSFAAAHGKQMTFPEWGLVSRPDGHGGGDDPYFVDRMADWIIQNNVAYHMYFELDAPDGRHRMMTGQFPQAASRFMSRFGPNASSTVAGDPPAGRGRGKVKARIALYGLRLNARVHRGRRQVVRLSWRAGLRIDVYRNGRRIARNVRRSYFKDRVRHSSRTRRVRYRVRRVAGNSPTWSNSVRVRLPRQRHA